MFDVAPSELLIVAIVALVVIGPKDLPKALRFVGHWIGKARGMAKHFRAGIDTMMRESEMEDMEKKWREHNDAIMRAYPQIDATLPPHPTANNSETEFAADAAMTTLFPSAGASSEPVSLAKPVGTSAP